MPMYRMFYKLHHKFVRNCHKIKHVFLFSVLFSCFSGFCFKLGPKMWSIIFCGLHLNACSKQLAVYFVSQMHSISQQYHILVSHFRPFLLFLCISLKIDLWLMLFRVVFIYFVNNARSPSFYRKAATLSLPQYARFDKF